MRLAGLAGRVGLVGRAVAISTETVALTLSVFYRDADAAKATPCGGLPRSLKEVQPEAAEHLVFISFFFTSDR